LANPTYAYFSQTGDLFVDALTTGYKWSLQSDRTVDVAVANGFLGEYWTVNPVPYLQAALDTYAYFGNIRFNYLGYYSDPYIAYQSGSEITLSLDGAYLFTGNQNVWAVGFFPNNLYDDPYWNYGYPGNGGDLYLNVNSQANFLPSYDPGSAGWFLLLHELGHTLGLKHPHDDGGTGRPTLSGSGFPDLDIDWATVMSYADDFNWNLVELDPAAPMVLDVLAIQYLYGKNTATNAGATTHYIADQNLYYTLWDASGNDTVSAVNATHGQYIFLPEYALSTLVDSKVGFVGRLSELELDSPTSLTWLLGDYENATGSAFSDEIYGNSFANVLLGGAGDDWLYGEGGSDSFSEEQGSDHISGGEGSDKYSLSSALANYRISFDALNDEFHIVSKNDSVVDYITQVETFSFVGTEYSDTSLKSMINPLTGYVDTVTPTILSFDPGDSEAGVRLDTSIKISFSEGVQRGNGTIQLRSGSVTGPIVETFLSDSPRVVCAEDGTVTIDPSNNLVDSTRYFVVLQNDAIRDFAGNTFAGTSAYDFITGDFTGPSVLRFTPQSGQYGVRTDANLVFDFNESLTRGSGYLRIQTAVEDGGILVAQIQASDTSQVLISGQTLTINPAVNLQENTHYCVFLDEGFVKDRYSNLSASLNSYEFTTGDFVAPVLVEMHPSDAESFVTFDENISLTFDEAIAGGSASIELRVGAPTGKVVESFAPNSSRILIDGSTLTIDPLAPISPGVQYFVVVAPGAIKDLSGNAYSGTAAYSFTGESWFEEEVVAFIPQLAPQVFGSAFSYGDGAQIIESGSDSSIFEMGAGSDTLYAGAGNDLIFGYQIYDDSDIPDIGPALETEQLNSIDVLYGGTGDDIYVLDRFVNRPEIFEYADGGIDTIYGDWDSFDLPDYVENYVNDLSITGALVSVYGNALNNTIISSYRNGEGELWSSDDYYDGGDGNDVLVSWAGNDILKGGTGSDLLIGGSGDDRIYGGTGVDTVVLDASWADVRTYLSRSNWYFYSSDGFDYVAYDVEKLRFSDGSELMLHAVSEDDDVFGPRVFTPSADFISVLNGDADIAAGAGNDEIYLSLYNAKTAVLEPTTRIVSGGAGVDTLTLGGAMEDWSFSTVSVDQIQALLKAKYPLNSALGGANDPFAWNKSALDVVMLATNAESGSEVYFQTEYVRFDGDLSQSYMSEGLLPAFEFSDDATEASAVQQTFIGRRSSDDTFSLKVADVDVALHDIGLWMDSVTVNPKASSLIDTSMVGATSIVLKAQSSTSPWFTGSSTVANAGYNLVDIENIRLWDSSGDSVTIRVVGSSGYTGSGDTASAVDQALMAADRGDVIYISEFSEAYSRANGVSVDTVSTYATSSEIVLDAGVRVLFEENRTTKLPTNVTNAVWLSEETVGRSEDTAGRNIFFYDGHAYEYIDVAADWQSAKTAAESSSFQGASGYLVSITSAGEQAAIVDGMSQLLGPDMASVPGIWLGASDSDTEGQWRWESGPDVGTLFWTGDATGTAVNGAFQNWDSTADPPQPNTDENADTEDYLWMTVSADWNNLSPWMWGDAPDWVSSGYLIEYTLTDSGIQTPWFGDTRAVEVLGSVAVDVVGSDLDDLIIGNRASNVIKGGNGDDIILGGSGADTILGQGGNDVLIGGSAERLWGFAMSAGLEINGSDEFGNPRLETIGGVEYNVQDTFWYDSGFLQTGDKLRYTFSDGPALNVLETASSTSFKTLTTGVDLYVYADDGAFKLASSAANLAAGNFMRFDVATWNNGTNHQVTLNNVTYSSATTLPGNDYVAGGSGDDTLISYGAIGSATIKNVADTVTLVGGSGDDRFELYANTGVVNMFGGSGADDFVFNDAFAFSPTLNKAGNVFDYSASDQVMSANPLETGLLNQLKTEGIFINGLTDSFEESYRETYLQLTEDQNVQDPGVPNPDVIAQNLESVLMDDVMFQIGMEEISLAALINEMQAHG
jgi:Ca2+-binding RTX toxin-like protein